MVEDVRDHYRSRRDYHLASRRPKAVLAPNRPQSASIPPSKPHVVKRKRGYALFFAIVFSLALLLFGLHWLRNRQPAPSPIPASIRSSAHFPLYYPQPLPPGFSLITDSFSANNQAVIYQIQAPGDVKVSVSLQAIPKGFNFEDFYRQTLREPKTDLLPIGSATYGKLNRGVMVSLETTRTWIIINSIAPLDYDQLKLLASSLRESN